MAETHHADSTEQPEPGYSNTEPGSPAATSTINIGERPLTRPESVNDAPKTAPRTAKTGKKKT